MLNYIEPGKLFSILMLVYFAFMITGLLIGKVKKISLKTIYQIGQKLNDPITTRIHRWTGRYKIWAIKNNKWPLLFMLIFLNNLILVAFVTRVLYGIIFFIPVLLIGWSGFSHGILFSKPRGNISVVVILEFASYLLASVIGVDLGLDILLSVVNNNPVIITIPWNYALYTVIVLILVALLETISMNALSKRVDLTKINQGDFEKNKLDVIEYLEEE